FDGRLKLLLELVCKRIRSLFGMDIPCQHEKFVPAQSGECIGLSDHFFEPPGDFLQDLVADSVAIGIVDGLELVEIEEKAGTKLVITYRIMQRLLDAVEQKLAVGQAGQAVMQSTFMLQPALDIKLLLSQEQQPMLLAGHIVGKRADEIGRNNEKVITRQRKKGYGLEPGEHDVE